MPNPENVLPHRWKKGQSGNPKGRPKKVPELNEIMARLLEEKETKYAQTELEKIIRALIKRAKKGDVRAIQEVLDRCYGKAKQQIEQDLSIIWHEELTDEADSETK